MLLLYKALYSRNIYNVIYQCITLLFSSQFSSSTLVVRHPLQKKKKSRKWASPPPLRALRCNAAPAMEYLRAFHRLSIPPRAPDPSIRNASPASFRVRWDGCSSMCVIKSVLFFHVLSSSLFPLLQIWLSPHFRINLLWNTAWQLWLQSLLCVCDCVFLCICGD